MEQEKLLRLLKITLAFNLFLLVANAAMFYLFIVFVVAEPSQVEGVIPTEQPTVVVEEIDIRGELQRFFDRNCDLLDRAARKHGVNPSRFVPSQEEVNAAVESMTMHSDESQAVLEKLREGFDYFDLAWPIVVPRY